MTGTATTGHAPEGAKQRSMPAALGGGAAIGALGGLIGLGGAEFRLPLLMGTFRFAALQAVILNKAMSLVVVAVALPFRAAAVPFADVAAQWPIIANLLAGSLLGAWLGAGWATRLASHTLYRVLAALLLLIAAVLLFGHDTAAAGALLTGVAQAVTGVLAGFLIGIVAALMGVAGGELLIPTLILLFGVDIKLAGSLSLAVESADDDCRLRPLQPGSWLHRPPRRPAVCSGHGGRLDPGELRWRPTAWMGPLLGYPSSLGRDSDRVGDQGLAPQVVPLTQSETRAKKQAPAVGVEGRAPGKAKRRVADADLFPHAPLPPWVRVRDDAGGNLRVDPLT